TPTTPRAPSEGVLGDSSRSRLVRAAVSAEGRTAPPLNSKPLSVVHAPRDCTRFHSQHRQERYRHLAGNLVASLPRGPGVDRAAVRAARAGGLRHSVDARRQSGEVAPRAHELVLRDLCAQARAGRLSWIGPSSCVPLQLVLQRGGTHALSGAARHDLASYRGGYVPLPAANGCRHAAVVRAGHRGGVGAGGAGCRTGTPPRAAASGAAVDGHQTHAGAEPTLAGLPSERCGGTSCTCRKGDPRSRRVTIAMV